MKDDRTATYLGFTSLHWIYAAKTGEYFYANDATNLHRFDFADLSDDYQAKAVAQNPFMVDVYDSLWSSANDTVFVWAADLSDSTAYPTPDGLNANWLHLSLNNEFLYLLEIATDSLRKYRVSTFKAGGDYIWSTDVGKDVASMSVTAGDTIIVYCVEQRAVIIDSAGNILGNSSVGYGYGCYSYENYKMYLPMYSYAAGGTALEVTENDLGGNNTGDTEDMATDTWCCSILDTNLYVGIYDHGSTGNYGVHQFSINGDWGANESAIGYYQNVNGKSYIFGGDPTGYINSQMSEPASTNSNFIIIVF